MIRTLTGSFERVSDSRSHITLLALVAGLLSLAIGLPTRSADELANSVLDDLLAARVGVLLAVLGPAFLAESVRCAADFVDDQSLMLAWPWALAFGPVPLIAAVWAFSAWRLDGFTHLRDFLTGTDDVPATRLT
ncbi:hypothetical protein [Mycobacterium sp. C31M]